MKIQGRVIFFVIISLLLQGAGWGNGLASGVQKAGSPRTAAPQSRSVRGLKPARLRDEAVVRPNGKRQPYLILSEGHAMQADYADQADMAIESLPEAAEPRGLASGDFDEDGMPDLVTAYATRAGGLVSIYRGNVDAAYPNSPTARAHKAAGTFFDSPFLSPARVFETFAAPDFVAVGDFDADGHLDVVTAQQGGSALNFMHGDGSGALVRAEALGLPGAVTAMAAGEVNRVDGLSHLVLAIQGTTGASLLVFEGVNGALKSQPEELALPQAASALTLGYLNDDAEGDIAVAAGDELLVVHGRDRKLSLGARAQAAVPPPAISRRTMPARVTSLAVGDFTGDMRLELGATTEDGSVYLIGDHTSGLSAERAGRQQALSIEPLAQGKGYSGKQLIGSNFSGLNHECLLMVDEANRKMYLWADDNERRERGDLTVASAPGVREEPAALDVEGEPVAALPMRLNRDGLNDLVVLRKGHSEPVILTTLVTGFTVCNNSDCSSNGCGSLRDLINRVNSQPAGGSYAINFDSQAFQGVPTIQISSDLPPLNRAIVFDGASTGNCNNNNNGLASPDDVSAQALNAVEITSTNFSNAVRVTNSSCMVQNFVINRVNNAVTLDSNTSNNQVFGNFIGTTTNSNGTLSNRGTGVFVNNARNNIIGGNPNAGGINVISGNNVGVDITIGNDNLVRFNNIGTNANLNTLLGNGLNVRVRNGAQRTRIGGSILPSPNGFDNAIWGSTNDGLLVDTASATLVQSNWFRLNQGDGVELRSAGGATVGGSVTTAQSQTTNFFWDNGGHAVNINGNLASNNLVQGNNLGVAFTATNTPVDHGNFGSGVFISGNASNNSVGSPTRELGNVIAFNHANGVTVLSGTGNLIASNRISNNLLLGIDLGNDGVDTNDALDADTGPNNHQNYPVLTAATVPPSLLDGEFAAQAVTTVNGTLNSEPNTSYTLEFYFGTQSCTGGGHQSSGSTPTKLTLANGNDPTVTTDGNGMASFSFQFALPDNAAAGFINATARKTATGDTSEFSLCQQVGTQTCTFRLSPTGASVGAASGTGNFAVTVENGCTWTAVSSDTSWLTTTSAGSGNGTVNYAFTQNTGTNQRSATITVGGQVYTVTQPGLSCTFTLAPTSASVGAASGTGNFTVTVGNGCTWTAVSSDTSWLTTSSNGNGNGTVNYAFTQNTSSSQRSATILVGGQTHTVTQAGVSNLTITSVVKDGKNFVVTGTGFVAGDSTLLVNGEEKKTRVDSSTSIFSKKGAKALSLPATLQVRNSNGAVSNVFTFQG